MGYSIIVNAGENTQGISRDGDEAMTVDIYGNRFFEPLVVLLMLFLISGTFYFRPQILDILFVASMVFLPWLALPAFRLKSKQTLINAKGLARGKVFIPWNEIKEIKIGSMSSSGLIVRFGDRNRRLWLPSCPEVYRKIVPRIMAACPNVVVSDKVRRIQADPDVLTKTPRWTGILLAIMGLLIFAFAAFAHSCEFTQYKMIAGLVVFLAVYLVAELNIQPAGTIERRFIHGSMLCFFAIFPTFISQLISLSIYVFELLYAIVGIYLLASGAMVLFRLRLKGWISTVMIVAVAAAVFWFSAGAVEAPHGMDITEKLGDSGHMPPFLWSSDGKVFADEYADGGKGEGQNLVDVETLQSRSLPRHDGTQMIWGIDDRIAVRTVSGKEDKKIYIYFLKEGREVEAATVLKGKKSFTIPKISPDGDFVCWVEKSADQSEPPELKVFDVSTASTRKISVNWPADKEIKWESCGWSKDRNIVILGKDIALVNSGDKPCILHLLTARFPEGTTEHWASQKTRANWNVSPNFRFAFALSPPEGNSEKSAVFIELATGREVRLRGTEIPQWTRDGKNAFRVTNVPGKGVCLCRFDVETCKETEILKIPDGAELVSLSPQGSYAFIRRGGMRLAPISLVNTTTGSERRMDISCLSSFFAFGLGNDFQRDFQRLSVWSNDERYFLVQLMDFPHRTHKTLIYALKH